MSRLEILEKSLLKKETLFNEKLNNHFYTVKEANGQPLNDKRNGQATLNKWDRQNSALRTLDASIQKTKDAIEKEKSNISYASRIKDGLPNEILSLMDSGDLIQWKKHPHTFFVNGVDKGRIVWLEKKKLVAHKYSSSIPDQEQRKLFVSIYNTLYKAINNK